MKKLIDNPAQLGAEAAALMVENFGSAFLQSEAAALKQATEWVALAFEAAEFYAEDDETDYQKFHSYNQRALDESYRACDYAKELREERDRIRDRKGAVRPASTQADTLALRCREIRDEITKVFTAIAEEALKDEGYQVPES